METKFNAGQFRQSCCPQASVLGNTSGMHIYISTAWNSFPPSPYLLEHRRARQGWAKGGNVLPGCD